MAEDGPSATIDFYGDINKAPAIGGVKQPSPSVYQKSESEFQVVVDGGKIKDKAVSFLAGIRGISSFQVSNDELKQVNDIFSKKSLTAPAYTEKKAQSGESSGFSELSFSSDHIGVLLNGEDEFSREFSSKYRLESKLKRKAVYGVGNEGLFSDRIQGVAKKYENYIESRFFANGSDKSIENTRRAWIKHEYRHVEQRLSFYQSEKIVNSMELDGEFRGYLQADSGLVIPDQIKSDFRGRFSKVRCYEELDSIIEEFQKDSIEPGLIANPEAIVLRLSAFIQELNVGGNGFVRKFSDLSQPVQGNDIDSRVYLAILTGEKSVLESGNFEISELAEKAISGLEQAIEDPQSFIESRAKIFSDSRERMKENFTAAKDTLESIKKVAAENKIVPVENPF